MRQKVSGGTHVNFPGEKQEREKWKSLDTIAIVPPKQAAYRQSLCMYRAKMRATKRFASGRCYLDVCLAGSMVIPVVNGSGG